ncbi:MAG: hypothetical protein AMS21_00735 [Gemmatimonas sp. SG8_38_2]|nr:MAG: hypothetical protein AMS21_00735 [Gemmatimonas sp. SG8_38_2]
MFIDAPLIAGQIGLAVTGLSVSQKAAMSLDVAAGSVMKHNTGETFTLPAPESKVFVADAVYPTQVFIGLIDNAGTTQVWVDVYVDDGSKQRAPVPDDNVLVCDLAWFTIAPGETDLLNGDVVRRVYL